MGGIVVSPPRINTGILSLDLQGCFGREGIEDEMVIAVGAVFVTISMNKVSREYTESEWG